MSRRSERRPKGCDKSLWGKREAPDTIASVFASTVTDFTGQVGLGRFGAYEECMPEMNSIVRRSKESYSTIRALDQNDVTERRVKFPMSPRKLRRNRLLQMNAKRKKLLQGISAGLNVSEAGRAAGYGTAQSAHRAMNLIRIHMSEVLDKMGLPAEKLLQNLARSLDAKKTLFFSHDGVVMDSRDVPDHDIQLRTAIELAKMHGLYPRRSARKSDDRSDGHSPPMINLGMATSEG
jgi:hypothetical protein